MIIKQTLSLLALSALMLLPAGIATADDIDVQTGSMRVRVSEDGTTIINSTPKQTIIVPSKVPTSRVRVLSNRNQRYSVWKNSQSTSNICNGKKITQQSTQSNRSGTSVNRTYSSTTTTSC
ncbi:hypothetical protein OGM63_09425 [Plectonema radiosum NIES-515]|uniref:Uncharacterized protein n=1 Tax=Plectonema radiosum NIES-515 TaxID=2986073 RepID=A0ABT3AX69_9CYAN|nr:hypothetical protein [Plectonema radiosum]MCV3213728.1 hypothetical protein [Plectonema radiosum NIES-515]